MPALREPLGARRAVHLWKERRERVGAVACTSAQDGRQVTLRRQMIVFRGIGALFRGIGALSRVRALLYGIGIPREEDERTADCGGRKSRRRLSG